MQNYEEFKTENMNNNKFLSNIVKASDIEIESANSILLKGQKINITEKALGQFMFDSGIGKRLCSKLNQTNNGSTVINGLKNFLGGNAPVQLVASSALKSVVGMYSKNVTAAPVTTDLFFESVEHVMNQFPNMEITSLRDCESHLEISTRDTSWGFDANSNDESFNGGLTFIYHPLKGIQVGPSNFRLVCANGLIIGDVLAEFIEVSNTKLQEFLGEISDPFKMRQYEMFFSARVESMKRIKASYAELETAFNKMKRLSYVENAELTINNEFIPLNEITTAYNNAKIDIENESTQFKKTATTPMSMWELVNHLTFVGSHKTSLSIGPNGQSQLQSFAGKLTSKKQFDAETLAPVIF